MNEMSTTGAIERWPRGTMLVAALGILLWISSFRGIVLANWPPFLANAVIAGVGTTLAHHARGRTTAFLAAPLALVLMVGSIRWWGSAHGVGHRSAGLGARVIMDAMLALVLLVVVLAANMEMERTRWPLLGKLLAALLAAVACLPIAAAFAVLAHVMLGGDWA